MSDVVNVIKSADTVETKYGDMAVSQINNYITEIRKMIFWCLLYADPKTSKEYPDVNIPEYQKNIMRKINGFNSIMFYPKELVGVIATLESALQLIESSEYTFSEYRRLILDAGAMAGKMKVGD